MWLENATRNHHQGKWAWKKILVFDWKPVVSFLFIKIWISQKQMLYFILYLFPSWVSRQGKKVLASPIVPNSHASVLSPTLCDPMECSSPDSSVHEIFLARILDGVGCLFLLNEIFLTQGLNPHLLSLLHWKVDSSPFHHLERKTLSACPHQNLFFQDTTHNITNEPVYQSVIMCETLLSNSTL